MTRGDYVGGISLRLRHPCEDVGSKLEQWGFDVRRSWLAGEARTTPRGNPLKGVWKESYAYARLDVTREALEPGLAAAADRLAPLSNELRAFAELGGYAELFVHWHFEWNSGASLGCDLMRRLADLQVVLSLDIYPELQPELKEMTDADAE